MEGTNRMLCPYYRVAKIKSIGNDLPLRIREMTPTVAAAVYFERAAANSGQE